MPGVLKNSQNFFTVNSVFLKKIKEEYYKSEKKNI